MFCTKCGQKNPDNYKFCSRCGNPLKQPSRVEAFIVKETKEERKEKELNEVSSESLENEDIVRNSSENILNPEENTHPINQYDEEGNLILPVYDEPKKSKMSLTLGIFVALIITAGGIIGYHYYIESISLISPYLQSKPDVEVKRFSKFIITWVSEKRPDLLESFYPGVRNIPYDFTAIDSKKIKIIQRDGDLFTVSLSPSVQIKMEPENRFFRIISSKGLFNFSNDDLDLLSKSGIEYENLTDMEIYKQIENLKDNERRKSFSSPDLDFFNLHGTVKSYTSNMGVGGDYLLSGKIEFNKDGYWINYTSVKINGSPIISLERNSQNQIIKLERVYTENDEGDILLYNWNGNQLSEVNGIITNGHFSYNNNIISAFTYMDSQYYEGEIIDYMNNIQYSDFKYDEMGNWISCFWKYTSTSSSYPDTNGIIKREIEYY